MIAWMSLACAQCMVQISDLFEILLRSLIPILVMIALSLIGQGSARSFRTAVASVAVIESVFSS